MKRLMILSGMLLLLLSACGPGSQASSGESPLPLNEDSAPVTLTPTEQAKIDPDLLTVIEWEEVHPGEGQKVAPNNFVFDSSGRVECIVVFDPDEIVVTPMWTEDEQWKNQMAAQLIIRYGGQVTMAYGHEVAGSMPLGQIKTLAQEDAVNSIFPDILIKVPDRGPVITATSSP